VLVAEVALVMVTQEVLVVPEVQAQLQTELQVMQEHLPMEVGTQLVVLAGLHL